MNQTFTSSEISAIRGHRRRGVPFNEAVRLARTAEALKHAIPSTSIAPPPGFKYSPNLSFPPIPLTTFPVKFPFKEE